MTDAPPLTLGTAGHIDHGKTALIGALTGKSTDRLPEEQRRGISIELGYAPLELPGGRQLSVVDVPGHERFVRTMVAGATGVDMFLLCVAADDGVMPQTREHMAVLAAARRGRRRGGHHEERHRRAGGGGRGGGRARPGRAGGAGLGAAAARGSTSCWRRSSVWPAAAGRADDAGPTRLHVDRSFTLRGIGTVVTGTLWAGSVGAGDAVRVLPRGLEARVRSVQVHDGRSSARRRGSAWRSTSSGVGLARAGSRRRGGRPGAR